MTEHDAHASEIEHVRYNNNDHNCMDPLAIAFTPLCIPASTTHDDSMMSKGDECN